MNTNTKCKVVALVVLIAIMICSGAAQSVAQQWKFMGGPYAEQDLIGDAYNIEFGKDMWLVAGLGTVLRGPFLLSRDQGKSWITPDVEWRQRYGEDDIKGGASRFAIHDDFILAGGSWDFLIRSIDGGNTWQDIPIHLPEYTFINDFLVLGDTVLAGTSKDIYFSRDKGTSWARFDEGIPAEPEVYQMIYYNKKLFAATSKGLFSSTDGGKQWKAAVGIPSNPIRTVAVSKGILITDGYRSTDHGATWLPLGKVNIDTDPAWGQVSLKGIYDLVVRGDTIIAETVLPLNNTFVSFCTYLSFDSGLTWERSRVLSFGDLHMVSKNVVGFFKFDREIYFDGSAFITSHFATGEYGLTRSIDLITWNNFGGKFKGSQLLASSRDYLYSVLGSKIFRSGDGESWRTMLTLPTGTRVGELSRKALVVHGDDVCFINEVDSFDQNGLYQSGDHGETWKLIPLPNDSIFEVVRIKPKTIIKSLTKFYIKDDNEQQWSELHISGFSDVKSIFLSEDDKLLAYNCRQIIQSIDLGKTWQLVGDLTGLFDTVDAPYYDPDDYAEECIVSLAVHGDTFVASVYRTWLKSDSEYFRGGTTTYYSHDMGKSGGIMEMIPNAPEIIFSPPPYLFGPWLSSPIGFFGANGYYYSRTGETAQTLKDDFPDMRISPSCSNIYIEPPYYYQSDQVYTPPCRDYTEMNNATVFKDKLFIHGVGGIWATELSAITVQPTPEEVTSVEESERERLLRIFPIPSKSTVKVQYLTLSNNAQVQVMDMFGRTLFMGKMVVSDRFMELELAVQHFAHGRYVVRVVDGGKVYTASIIRE